MAFFQNPDWYLKNLNIDPNTFSYNWGTPPASTYQTNPTVPPEAGTPSTPNTTLPSTNANPNPTYAPNILNDWNAFFTGTPAGSNRDWAGGTLSMGEGGLATFLDPAGNSLQFTNTTPLSELYNNPFIRNLWQNTYGVNEMMNMFGGSGTGGNTGDTGGSNNFDVPTNLYPQSSSSQASSGSSMSGVDWNSPFLQNLLPLLERSMSGLEGTIGGMADTLQNQYGNMMRQALGPQAFQGTMNNLASRGMLNSRVADTAMTNTAKSIMKDIANQGYTSLLAQMGSQLELPYILRSLATLGQTARSATTSTGAGGSANPLAPYDLMAQLMMF